VSPERRRGSLQKEDATSWDVFSELRSYHDPLNKGPHGTKDLHRKRGSRALSGLIMERGWTRLWRQLRLICERGRPIQDGCS